MFKKLFILAIALQTLFAIREQYTTIENLESYTFEKYLFEYEKVYDNIDEYKQREETFNKNLALIIKHNSNPDREWTMGINFFADHTKEQMKPYKGLKKDFKFTSKSFLEKPTIKKEYPKSLDWRKTPGVLTETKNQKDCGACWAFSATESMESAIAIATGQPAPVLSPQEINDCTPNPKHCGGTGGCEGATPELAFEYAIQAGLASESDYPYLGKDATCQMSQKKPVAHISSYVKVKENDQDSLIEALQKGPVSVSLDAGWTLYFSGIFSGCEKDADIDHAVQAVGYDMTNPDKAYWIIRNSWGRFWGMKGYMYLKMFPNSDDYCGTDSTPKHGLGCDGGPSSVHVCGMCGILYHNTYPVV